MGKFTAHPTTPSFGAGNSRGVALGDLDGDGDPDAIVANTRAQAETVWLNNGLGSFSPSTTPSFGAGDSFAVVLGDLDRDGDPDAVVANSSGQAETVWSNVNAESVAPACSYMIVNANPRRIDFSVNDAGTGLVSIQITAAANIVQPVNIPSFTPGSTSPVAFSVVKDNQAQPARVAVVITDIQGNQANCI
ncbi:MAG: FG-GAP repeat domain-containing protein [Acidimicrobiales bacterium]